MSIPSFKSRKHSAIERAKKYEEKLSKNLEMNPMPNLDKTHQYYKFANQLHFSKIESNTRKDTFPDKFIPTPPKYAKINQTPRVRRYYSKLGGSTKKNVTRRRYSK
jgi:hypothetical protein